MKEKGVVQSVLKTTKKEKTKQNKKNNRIRGEGSYGERMRDK